MRTLHRRDFIKNSAGSAAGIIVAPAYIPHLISNSPNERVNIGLAGISGPRQPEIFKHGLRGMIPGRGITHINTYAKIPNVMITKVCDVDERLFPGVVSEHADEFRIDVNHAPVRPALENGDRSVVKKSLKTPFAFAKRVFRLLLVRYVPDVLDDALELACVQIEHGKRMEVYPSRDLLSRTGFGHHFVGRAACLERL